MSRLNVSDLKPIHRVSSIPASRYIVLDMFNPLIPCVAYQNYVQGGSYTFTMYRNSEAISSFQLKSGTNYLIFDNDDVKAMSGLVSDTYSLYLDLGSIKPSEGTPCSLIFYCYLPHYMQYAFASVFDVFSNGISLNSSQLSKLDNINNNFAKKSDLQFVDSSNKTWELMDLITANLPFRFID